jgi:JmjC domain
VESYSFEDFAGDRATFFETYFNKSAMVRPGALAGRLDGLPSVRQLDDILALEAAPPSYLRVSIGGKGVPRTVYSRTVSRGAALAEAINPDKVYELFRAGGTVTWNSMSHFLPSVRPLVRTFTDTFACNTEIVLFVTPAGNDGFAPHQDSVDVFVVQVDGTKTWKVWETRPDRSSGEATYTLDELGAPAIEVTLAPGDVLYVPHGTPHAASAKGALSVHLSIGIQPRRWRDLLRATVDAIVEDDDFHGFPALAAGSEQAAILDLPGRLRLLQDRLAAIGPAEEIARLAAVGRREGGAGSRREFERLAAVDGLTPGTRVRRGPVPVIIGESDGTRTGLTVAGNRLAVPDGVVSALHAVEGGGPVPAAEFFPGVSETRSLRAVQGLVRLGVLEVADEKETT